MIYIDTHSTDPAFHFALEEYFCTQKELGDTIFLLWQTKPTVMLGNFQNSYKELNREAIERDGVQVVRRNTGGGTIYTDEGSFQYSFLMKHASQMIDFGCYMDPIIAALGELKVDACYNSRNDLAIAGKKISGNAQCTKGAYTIHHGSLLYQTDFAKMASYLCPPKYKIESKGIQSVRDRTTNIYDHLENNWSTQVFKEKFLQAILRQGTELYQLTDADRAAIERLADAKFRTWEWTFGKNPSCTIEKGKKYQGGYLSFALTVKQGLITECHVTGDFFSAHDIHELEQALLQQPLDDSQQLAKVLKQPKFQHFLYQISPEDILDCLIG